MENIEKCRVSDTSAMVRIANSVIKNNIGGNPSMGLQKLDPLLLGHMEFSQNTESSKTKTIYENVVYSGLTDAQVISISGFQTNPDKNKLEIHVKVPKIIFKGDYETSGNIFKFNVLGKGKSETVFNEVDIHLTLITKKVTKDGKDYIQIRRSSYKYETKKYATCLTSDLSLT